MDTSAPFEREQKQNEPLASLTHFIGTLFSVAGLALLVVYAARYGSAAHVVGFTVFGTSLVLLYLASSLYHYIPITSSAKRFYQRIDHAMIFVLIAGTYTPITLMFPERAWGWSIFGIIWGLALLGIVAKAGGFHLNKWYTVVPYLAMGWLMVVAFEPLARFMPERGVWWLMAGGVFYTVGVVFFALERVIPRRRWFGMHEVFHLFVLAGSFCHFWLMFKYVLYL